MRKRFVLLACSPPSKFTVKFDVLFVFFCFSCLAPCLNSCGLFLKSCFSRANNMFFDHYCRIIMRNCTFCALCGYFIFFGLIMITRIIILLLSVSCTTKHYSMILHCTRHDFPGFFITRCEHESYKKQTVLSQKTIKGNVHLITMD